MAALQKNVDARLSGPSRLTPRSGAGHGPRDIRGSAQPVGVISATADCALANNEEVHDQRVALKERFFPFKLRYFLALHRTIFLR